MIIKIINIIKERIGIMIKKTTEAILTGLMVCLFAFPASAHFQMFYTPESALEKGETIDMKLVFTHPFEAGHTMDMGQPEVLYVVHKGQKTDLLKNIKPIVWTSLTNSGKAYELQYKLKGMGDYAFCLIPAPYYEAQEELYIQQMTKVLVNVAGIPTDWDEDMGLPAEIVPLDKPYALWTGNVFRGIVKRDGKPVPFAEIEVEYLNHDPITDKNSFAKEAHVEAPQDAFVTMAVKADMNGCFTFGIPKAGWWGFAALGAGPENTHDGKELSQDAVIWIQARDMK
jgi:cobalt/nickel transport protein